MSDGQKMQADGGGKTGSKDGVSDPKGGTSESAGGAYPNPHGTDAKPDAGGFMGHGGQSDIAYHGTGQLGDEKVNGEKNANSPSED